MVTANLVTFTEEFFCGVCCAIWLTICCFPPIRLQIFFRYYFSMVIIINIADLGFNSVNNSDHTLHKK